MKIGCQYGNSRQKTLIWADSGMSRRIRFSDPLQRPKKDADNKAESMPGWLKKKGAFNTFLQDVLFDIKAAM